MNGERTPGKVLKDLLYGAVSLFLLNWYYSISNSSNVEPIVIKPQNEITSKLAEEDIRNRGQFAAGDTNIGDLLGNLNLQANTNTGGNLENTPDPQQYDGNQE